MALIFPVLTNFQFTATSTFKFIENVFSQNPKTTESIKQNRIKNAISNQKPYQSKSKTVSVCCEANFLFFVYEIVILKLLLCFENTFAQPIR